jgi:hypothetical protein
MLSAQLNVGPMEDVTVSHEVPSTQLASVVQFDHTARLVLRHTAQVVDIAVAGSAVATGIATAVEITPAEVALKAGLHHDSDVLTE